MKQAAGALREVSAEVFYSDGGFLAVDRQMIDMLKRKAQSSPRRRCRLCFHASSEELQQEMLIVMHCSSYVRPHRHLRRAETLSVIEGACDTILFDESGVVTDCLPMSPAAEGGSFFYKMPAGIFHTLNFQSEYLVFLETTIGPFDPASSEAAPWAPAETDATAGHAYLASLVGDSSPSRFTQGPNSGN